MADLRRRLRRVLAPDRARLAGGSGFVEPFGPLAVQWATAIRARVAAPAGAGQPPTGEDIRSWT